MTFTEFLTTHCQTSKTTITAWRPLYDDAAHGKRPATNRLMMRLRWPLTDA